MKLKNKIEPFAVGFLNADKYEVSLYLYGNTEKIEEQIHTNENNINMQVAFVYEEEKQRTRCYIGTPILNHEY